MTRFECGICGKAFDETEGAYNHLVDQHIDVLMRRYIIETNAPPVHIQEMFSDKDFETIQIIQEASELPWSEFLFEAVRAYEREVVGEQ